MRGEGVGGGGGGGRVEGEKTKSDLWEQKLVLSQKKLIFVVLFARR